MTRRWIASLAACAVGLALPAAAPAALAATVTENTPATPTERRVMVMLKLGADHFSGADYGGGAYGNVLSAKARERVAKRIAREHGLTFVDSWAMPRIGVDCIILAIRDDRSMDAVVTELSALPEVSWSQPLNEFRMQGASAQPYNDKLYAAQPVSSRWHLGKLHRYATGKGVTVAIIDSRIDIRHPDLAGQIAASPDFAPSSQREAERHGTGVAGIIAARPGNSMGIAGIAPGARVLGLRACWERPRGGTTVCDSLSLARALVYALDNHADVINMSLTGPRDQLIATLIGQAIRRGTTVVAAIDESHPATSFPALVQGVVPVADERLSARGPGVYIAPGLDVPTTEPEGKWSLVSGSSYAAAHVTGLAALVRQLSGSRGKHASTNQLLGPQGRIDACAAIARYSQLDAGACQTGR